MYLAFFFSFGPALGVIVMGVNESTVVNLSYFASIESNWQCSRMFFCLHTFFQNMKYFLTHDLCQTKETSLWL